MVQVEQIVSNGPQVFCVLLPKGNMLWMFQHRTLEEQDPGNCGHTQAFLRHFQSARKNDD